MHFIKTGISLPHAAVVLSVVLSVVPSGIEKVIHRHLTVDDAVVFTFA